MSDEVAAPKKGKAKKNEKSTALKLTDYKLDIRKKELTKLAGDYNNLVITKETFDQAKLARAKLREERYIITDIEKDNNKKLNAFKTANKTNAEVLIGIIRPVEDRIHKGIKDIENEKERLKEEKAAAEQAETDRLEALDNKVDQFDRDGMSKVLEAKTMEELDVLKTNIDKYDVSPQGSYKEKSPDAFMIKKKLLKEIESRRATVKELDEARKAKDELEELRAEKAKREKEELEWKEEQKLVESQRREAEIIDMQNSLTDLGLSCIGDNFEYGEFGISAEELEKMTLLEFNKKLRKDIQPKIEAIKKDEKIAEEKSKKFELRKSERREKLETLGLVFDGDQYAYADINFHWQELITMSDEDFDKQFKGAQARMKVIKKEELTAEAAAKKKAEEEAAAAAAEAAAAKKKTEDEAAEKIKQERKEYQDEWIYTIENLSKVPTAFVTLNTEAVEVAIESGTRKIAGLKICQRKNLTK